LDVREPDEYARGHITPLLVPVGSLMARLDALENYKEQELIVHCRSGKRSAAAVEVLKQSGFSNPRNLVGGMLAWKDEVDPNFVV
ncbi:MAG: rhodanese-like domain-containing protein, partial [Pseudomonadota bacterium]